MNVILCEKAYFDSSWCKQILQGLKNELKKRRIEYSVVFELDDINSDNIFFVIGSDYKWMSDYVAKVNYYGITPILIFNQSNHIISGRYHSVSSDIGGSILALVKWLKNREKNNICLYGVNPESISDISRNQSYAKNLEMGKTFYNNGSLENCFKSFISCNECFDAVICTNDFAAISLVKNLIKHNAEMLQRLDIISCSQSSISAYFGDYIKSININLTSLGTNAYQVARTAQNGENISEISLTVKWNMEFDDENITRLFEDGDIAPNAFYEDAELSNLMKLDMLVDSFDNTDKNIIRLLMSGDTYSDIAEACYTTERNVKYRVKQYLKKCNVNSRKEFIDFLNEYHIKIT